METSVETTPEPSKSNVMITPPSTRLIELNLMGQKIMIRTAANAETTDSVTALVKERLKAAEGRMKVGFSAPHLPAILALFDIAEEYLEAKKRVQAHQSEIAEKLGQLKVSIEE